MNVGSNNNSHHSSKVRTAGVWQNSVVFSSFLPIHNEIALHQKRGSFISAPPALRFNHNSDQCQIANTATTFCSMGTLNEINKSFYFPIFKVYSNVLVLGIVFS